MDKNQFYRILQCSMMFQDKKTEIEINKQFTFEEMEYALKIIEVLGIT